MKQSCIPTGHGTSATAAPSHPGSFFGSHRTTASVRQSCIPTGHGTTRTARPWQPGSVAGLQGARSPPGPVRAAVSRTASIGRLRAGRDGRGAAACRIR